jgi:hypothetical protein
VSLRLYAIHDLKTSGCVARALSLPEAFSRMMAMDERELWLFPRTARVMHLVIIPSRPDDPMFQSGDAVDRKARNDIMAQVLAHGLGRFRVTPVQLDELNAGHSHGLE